MFSFKYYEINENSVSSNNKCELNVEESKLYGDIVDAISKKDFVKYQQLWNENNDFKKWINKTVLVKKYFNDIQKDQQSICIYNALSLCHLAAKNNAQEIMKSLIRNGGDLSKQVIEVHDLSTMKKITYKETAFSLIIIHFREPIVFLKGLLDDSISCEDKENDYEFNLDFSILCPSMNNRWTTNYVEKHDVQHMSVLNSILNSTDDIHSEQYELLNHPLIEAFLTCKWKHYRLFFFTLVFLHLMFVSCLSTAIVLVVKSFQLFQNESIEILVTKNVTSLEDVMEINRLLDASEKFHCMMKVIKIMNLLAFVCAGFLFVHAIIQASFISLRKLLTELEILLNLFTAPCTMVTCIQLIIMPYEAYFDKNQRWIYHVSSFIILPVWINLMLLVGRLPRLGCYSLMFTTVLQNFLKVMISFIFLLIGFALSFSLVFPNSEYFRDPAHALLRTMVMMIGEFDYTTTFSDEEDCFIIGTSRIIFLLFIISCSIILMNLTQGIAVNDIKLLHEISQVIRLEKETRFLYELECVFSHQIMTSHPFLRKIKRKLYDHGTNIETIRVTRDQKQGLSNAVYDRLVKDFKKMH